MVFWIKGWLVSPISQVVPSSADSPLGPRATSVPMALMLGTSFQPSGRLTLAELSERTTGWSGWMGALAPVLAEDAPANGCHASKRVFMSGLRVFGKREA